MVSTKAVRQALYQRLNVASVTSLLANGSASLFHGVAPPSAAFPVLIFHKQSGVSDGLVFGGDHMDNHLWLVKGVVRGDGSGSASASVAEDIDKAVYDRLHFGDLTITGADDMYLARESDVNYAETQGDTVFWHVGGLYRLRFQDT